MYGISGFIENEICDFIQTELFIHLPPAMPPGLAYID